MTAGMLLLTIAAVLVFCGLLQRVLDRMYLTDRQALLIIGAMIIGTLLPNITLGPVSVNLGGAVIPLGVCAYLLIRADEPVERWRTLLGTVLTGGAVYGLCGGILAWVLCRSRRGAFACGVAGVILADITSAVVAWAQGYQAQLVLGGAGIADATVISGVLAVLLCELVGETIERLVRGHAVQRGGRN